MGSADPTFPNKGSTNMVVFRNFVCLFLALLLCTAMARAQHTESGYASFYADRFHGKKTASGEPYNKNAFTAAHRSLPFGTTVKVTRVDNHRSVVVKINDRGPFVKGRVIELSRAAARQIDLLQNELVMVKLEVIRPGQMEVSTTSLEEMPPDDRIPASPSSPAARGLGLFHVDAFRAYQRGYGIQLGAYAEFQNVLEAINNLQRKNQRKTMVHIARNDRKVVFRLIIGPFDTKKEAEVYQRKLRLINPNGIIVDLSKLE